MSDGLEALRVPSRLADPDEGITIDELRLASRNHGMPMELLREDVTPSGSHYVLTHYDIPAVDPVTWRLDLDGAVGSPLTLDLAALRAMPSRTVRATMECAGNGRAALLPRPLSQPWLNSAVGTADWTGVPLADLLEAAGVDERRGRRGLHRARPRDRARHRAGLPARTAAGRRHATTTCWWPTR